MSTYYEEKQKEKQEEAQAKKVARANEADERKRRKAANSGKNRGLSTKKHARLSEAICQRANYICSTLPKIPEAPAHDYSNYIKFREAAYDSGESDYCIFRDGPKHVTRQFKYGHKKKKRDRDTGKVSVEIIPYSKEHNDRAFESDNALHIDPEREKENLYWNIYDGYYRPSPFDRKIRVKTDEDEEREKDPWLSKYGIDEDVKTPLRFADAELRFVHEHFAAAIDCQNAKHKKAGNIDRILDTDNPKMWHEWMKTHQPQEILIEIGSRDDSVKPDVLQKITPEFLNALKEKYNFVAIDFALHCDEKGAPHVHARGYYIGVDENGFEIPSRSLALDQRGIAPSLGKKHEQWLISKGENPADYDGKQFYNTTVPFTEEASEILFQLAEKHGVKVARTPYKRGGLSQRDYLDRLKSSPQDAKIALEKLEKPISTQEKRQCILTILEAVDKGLNYYPTQWTDPNAVAQAEREMRPALKKAREITEQLPEILRKQHIESPDAELEKLQQRIARTQRALGRARKNAGSEKAKPDEGNRKKHAERLEWLRKLQRMHELLMRDDLPSYDEEHAARLAAEAKLKEAEDKLKEAEAKLKARDDEAAKQQPAQPTVPPMHQQHQDNFDLARKMQQMHQSSLPDVPSDLLRAKLQQPVRQAPAPKPQPEPTPKPAPTTTPTTTGLVDVAAINKKLQPVEETAKPQPAPEPAEDTKSFFARLFKKSSPAQAPDDQQPEHQSRYKPRPPR